MYVNFSGTSLNETCQGVTSLICGSYGTHICHMFMRKYEEETINKIDAKFTFTFHLENTPKRRGRECALAFNNTSGLFPSNITTAFTHHCVDKSPLHSRNLHNALPKREIEGVTAARLSSRFFRFFFSFSSRWLRVLAATKATIYDECGAELSKLSLKITGVTSWQTGTSVIRVPRVVNKKRAHLILIGASCSRKDARYSRRQRITRGSNVCDE